jgi:endonuclease/exonuclease/phosphatase family metal-dependent hydrolase
LKKIIYRSFLLLNILFAAALIFSYLAVRINPAVFALPALFGLAYPYLLLVNIIFALVWIVALRYEAFISIVIIALGITHFSNYIKLTRTSGDKTGAIKILSYNVRLFNYFEGRKIAISEKKITELLEYQQADIICLQEVYFTSDPEQTIQTIISSLGGHYFSHLKLLSTGKNKYYGIITLSKFPIVRKGDIVHPGSSSLSIYSDIVAGNDTFRIFNNHLQSFRLRRMSRSFLNELKNAPGNNETFNEIKTISVSLKSGFVRRAIQAQVVKARIDKSPYPVIVAGDFNDTPVSYSYRKIKKGLNDSFLTAGYGAGFTYRGNYPPNRIDYILYGRNLECRYFEIIKVRYSDHYPIVAYFRKQN